MIRKILFAICLLLLTSGIGNATPMNLASPDGNIIVSIQLKDRVYYQVEYLGETVLWYSPVTMSIKDGPVLGYKPVLENRSEVKEVDNTISTAWGSRKEIKDHYKELRLDFQNNFSLIFRAYNDGIAYRFVTDLKGEILVENEEVRYRFLEDHEVMFHPAGNFQTSYERLYENINITEIGHKNMGTLPLLVKANNNARLVITEADLYDYPGMYIYREPGNRRKELQGIFASYPTKTKVGGGNQFRLVVEERADYIAKTSGKRNFPWRVMVITNDDKKLADNDLVYKLSRPSKIATEWIVPGKASWEWWNDWNLEGVDFKAGINQETYKYYIDFAAENNMKYVIMDEGWSDQFDLTLQRPGIDVPELSAYAAKKGVKLILWCVWHTLDRQKETVLPMFREWGIAGVKVDFIDRDDQVAINFYEDLAKACAEHELIIDYHGCSKPTGLHRTYPNVLNYEGVRGNEYNKFSKGLTPDHNVDIVFTRMIAGPMDYTPGAMLNSIEGNFHQSGSTPMSHGTRCHQLGMYIVYEAPLQMLCDAPSRYREYPDILTFLSKVPVTWDETMVLDAILEEYVATARKSGDEWYVGAITNWEEREITIDFSFLGDGEYKAEILKDGINANRIATDYQYDEMEVTAGSKERFVLKKGGGLAMRIFPVND